MKIERTTERGYEVKEETISNGGFVCKNENEYVESIIKLCNDTELYEKMSYNAKQRAMDFEQNKITLESFDDRLTCNSPVKFAKSIPVPP
jgi:glycosyltransferase involved in cell wall biosynthesis